MGSHETPPGPLWASRTWKSYGNRVRPNSSLLPEAPSGGFDSRSLHSAHRDGQALLLTRWASQLVGLLAGREGELLLSAARRHARRTDVDVDESALRIGCETPHQLTTRLFGLLPALVAHPLQLLLEDRAEFLLQRVAGTFLVAAFSSARRSA